MRGKEKERKRRKARAEGGVTEGGSCHLIRRRALLEISALLSQLDGNVEHFSSRFILFIMGPKGNTSQMAVGKCCFCELGSKAGAQIYKHFQSLLEQALSLVVGDGFRQPGFGGWG